MGDQKGNLAKLIVMIVALGFLFWMATLAMSGQEVVRVTIWYTDCSTEYIDPKLDSRATIYVTGPVHSHQLLYEQYLRYFKIVRNGDMYGVQGDLVIRSMSGPYGYQIKIGNQGAILGYAATREEPDRPYFPAYEDIDNNRDNLVLFLQPNARDSCPGIIESPPPTLRPLPTATATPIPSRKKLYVPFVLSCADRNPQGSPCANLLNR